MHNQATAIAITNLLINKTLTFINRECNVQVCTDIAALYTALAAIYSNNVSKDTISMLSERAENLIPDSLHNELLAALQ